MFRKWQVDLIGTDRYLVPLYLRFTHTPTKPDVRVYMKVYLYIYIDTCTSIHQNVLPNTITTSNQVNVLSEFSKGSLKEGQSSTQRPHTVIREDTVLKGSADCPIKPGHPLNLYDGAHFKGHRKLGDPRRTSQLQPSSCIAFHGFRYCRKVGPVSLQLRLHPHRSSGRPLNRGCSASPSFMWLPYDKAMVKGSEGKASFWAN